MRDENEQETWKMEKYLRYLIWQIIRKFCVFINTAFEKFIN